MLVFACHRPAGRALVSAARAAAKSRENIVKAEVAAAKRPLLAEMLMAKRLAVIIAAIIVALLAMALLLRMGVRIVEHGVVFGALFFVF